MDEWMVNKEHTHSEERAERKKEKKKHEENVRQLEIYGCDFSACE